MKIEAPIPREHGAWAMVYAPLVLVVAMLGHLELKVLLFLIAVTAVFLAHEPLVSMAKLKPAYPSRRAKWRQSAWWLVIYLSVAALAGIPLVWFYRRWYLAPMGLALSGLLAIHTYLAAQRAERKISGEFLGVLGMTLTAPGAYYVVTGRLDSFAGLLWLLNLLYFTSGIFYVKMRVSRFAKRPEAGQLTGQCAGYHLLVLAAVGGMVWLGWVTILVIIAFAPVVLRALRAMLSSEPRLNLKRIGWMEVVYTVVFVVCVSLGLKPF